MISLRKDEQILLVLRRHWFVLVETAFEFLFALLAPPVGIVLADRHIPTFFHAVERPLILVALSLYVLSLLTWALVAWLRYYLDAWIITDDRIITIEQHGLFHREISGIAIERIQNVTIEIPGFIATTFGFGTILIETAGEGSFRLTYAPHCQRAKDLILEYSRKAKGEFDNANFRPDSVR